MGRVPVVSIPSARPRSLALTPARSLDSIYGVRLSVWSWVAANSGFCSMLNPRVTPLYLHHPPDLPGMHTVLKDRSQLDFTR